MRIKEPLFFGTRQECKKMLKGHIFIFTNVSISSTL